MDDIDWLGSSYGVSVDSPTEVKPPQILLLVTALLSVVGVALALVNPRWGYLGALIASMIGGFAALTDQKRRAESNYVDFSWFLPTLRSVRLLALAVACLNIALWAIEIAQGSSWW